MGMIHIHDRRITVSFTPDELIDKLALAPGKGLVTLGRMISYAAVRTLAEKRPALIHEKISAIRTEFIDGNYLVTIQLMPSPAAPH